MIQKNVLEYLEDSSRKYPDHVLCCCGDDSITYKNAVVEARNLGSRINKELQGGFNQPVIIYIDKSIDCLIAMLGILYSGNYYVCIDTAMPIERLNSIMANLHPVAVVSVRDKKVATDISKECSIPLVLMDDNKADICISDNALNEIRNKVIATDPAYILYTSGSTGVPKGSVITHRAVIEYADWLQETFGFDHDTVFGSQTPFYFSMSVLDIYSTLKNGATLVLIPKKLFSFPIQLLQYMDEHGVNTIYWVPSAMGIVAKWKALEYVELPKLKKILFAGEVMPNKILNRWREHIPDAMYANLFGPTEITDIALYYIVDRKFKDEDSLPIGICATSMNAFALNEDNKIITSDEVGELYFRGPFLGSGYYNSSNKTNEAFVQNPLNDKYPEIVYKTGDLVRINDHGEFMYVGRKDSQIKHSGYRIELGEIEHAANCMAEVESCVALYDSGKDDIVLIYQGQGNSDVILKKLKEDYLPSYMIPERIENIKTMPYNANGKIDRVKLREMYIG